MQDFHSPRNRSSCWSEGALECSPLVSLGKGRLKKEYNSSKRNVCFYFDFDHDTVRHGESVLGENTPDVYVEHPDVFHDDKPEN